MAGSTAYDATTRTVTFTPSSALADNVAYTATVAGTDQSGNPVASGGTWSFTTAKAPASPGVCPCTLFDDATTPAVLDSGEQSPVTLGVRFASSSDGLITGVRFYKGPNNTGTHTASLWSTSGTELATGTFTGESSAGWQTLTFAQPVTIKADTEYVVSYRSPTGSYSLSPNQFAASNLSRSPLRVAPDSGAFTYGTGYPGGTSSSNYLVDPVFEYPSPTISVTSLTPPAGAVGVSRATNISATFSTAIQASGWSMSVTQNGAPVAGTTSLGSAGTEVTFTPSTALDKDVDVTVLLSGVVGTTGAVLRDQTWTFHTSGSSDTTPEQTLMGDETPQVPATDDGASVELGTAFTPQSDGTVTGVRFFKGAGNGGTHTGSLWDASGNRLATVTFTGETASGWQAATFATPVAVKAGKTYVVSYLAPQGHYSATAGYFAAPKVSGDLTAPATSNGRYLYGGGGSAPTYSWQATNYFVDVVFKADPPTVAVASRTPAPGATDVNRADPVSITFTSAVVSSTSIGLTVGGTAVAGTTTRSDGGATITFTPGTSLPPDNDVTATVSGIATAAGATLPDQSWTFHTEKGTTTTLLGGSVPATASVDDSSSVELGMAFTTSVAGSVTAIRFYKGAGNDGTHTGSLWDDAGNRLATVTFTGETASGWQTAALPTPVALTPGRTYVVSYLAPQGHYSATPAGFSTPVDAGPLSAASAGNGRYRYGGGYPTSSYNATNYFVDVAFRS